MRGLAPSGGPSPGWNSTGFLDRKGYVQGLLSVHLGMYVGYDYNICDWSNCLDKHGVHAVPYMHSKCVFKLALGRSWEWRVWPLGYGLRYLGCDSIQVFCFACRVQHHECKIFQGIANRSKNKPQSNIELLRLDLGTVLQRGLPSPPLIPT